MGYVISLPFQDALDERITNTKHPIDLIFEDPSTQPASELSDTALVMKYKKRVYGIVHGGYHLLDDTKPCTDVLVDGKLLSSKRVLKR